MEGTQGAGVDFPGLLGSMLHAMSQPIGGKPGGYVEDIFLDLSDEEKGQLECNICFLILKDPRECPNHHLFCASCIFRWSMNIGETNSKCPVCRTEGRYKPCADADSKLAVKHVKCPQKDCTWAGKLRDFKWHRRSHNDDSDDDSIDLPPITPRGGNSRNNHSVSDFPNGGINRRQRLQHLMDTFHDRMRQRRANIEQHQIEQERARQESLQEVEHLSQQLGDVSTNLVRLLDNMHEDSRRYNRYVHEVQDILPPPVTTIERHQRHHNGTVGHHTDAARVEDILSTPTPSQNPFVVPDEFRLPPRAISVTSNASSHGPSIGINITPRLPRRRRTVPRPGQLRQRYAYGNIRQSDNDTG